MARSSRTMRLPFSTSPSLQLLWGLHEKMQTFLSTGNVLGKAVQGGRVSDPTSTLPTPAWPYFMDRSLLATIFPAACILRPSCPCPHHSTPGTFGPGRAPRKWTWRRAHAPRRCVPPWVQGGFFGLSSPQLNPAVGGALHSPAIAHEAALTS